MAFARRQTNATLLPDGKVLVTGGTSSPGFNDPAARRAMRQSYGIPQTDAVDDARQQLGDSAGLPLYCGPAARWPGLKHGRQR